MTKSSKMIGQAAVQHAAIEWHVRLTSGDVQDETWERFAAWYGSDPAHQSAFDEVEILSGSVAEARDALLQKLGEPTSAAGTSAELEGRQKLLIAFWNRSGAGAFAIAAALILSVALLFQLFLFRDGAYEIATAQGELRKAFLDDGSQLDLDADTVVEVDYSTSQRRVVLSNGRAFFDVNRRAELPFVVEADDREIRVLGTAFEVEHRNGALRVSVLRGKVTVTQSGAAPATQWYELVQGDQLKFTVDSELPQQSNVDPADIGAWRDGRFVFDDVPLIDVLERLNRYLSGDRFEMQGSEASGLRFTGVIRMSDADTLAARLEGLLPVATERQGRAILVGRRHDDAGEGDQ